MELQKVIREAFRKADAALKVKARSKAKAEKERTGHEQAKRDR